MSKPSFFGKLKPPHRATASQQAIPATSSHLSPPQIKLPSEDLLNEDNNKKAGNQESSLNPKEKSGRRLSNSPSSFRLRRHSALELPQDIDVTTKYHTTHSKTPTSVKGTISFSCFPSFSVYSIPTASRFWRSWFLFENMLNILHIFLIPLMTGWTSHFINWGLVVYFVLIDFISLLDCIFSSLVIIKDNYGLYIVVPQELQSLYFSDRYNIFRLILCVPIELLVFVPVASPGLFPTMAASNESLLQYQFQLWAIMKFIRFFLRFPYKKIYELKIPGIALPISRLIKTMLILMTLGHIDACIFWFLDNCIQGPGRWIDTYNLVTDPTTGLPVDFTTQYLDSYLTAVRSLVLKIRVVEKNPENVYVLLEFICGILSYGTVFGTIHSIVEMLDTSVLSTHAEEVHKFEMRGLRKYMKEKAIKPDLQKMILSHKELNWRRSQGMNYESCCRDIPRLLQQELKNYLYLDMIKKVPLFKDADNNFLQSIALKIKPFDVLKDWYLFRKGDEGEEMYFIKNGKVAIVGDQGQVFVVLSEGSFFGEIALVEDCKRTASARADSNCELLILTKEDFLNLIHQYPQVAEIIARTIEERKINEAKVKAAAALKAKEEADAKERERIEQERLARQEEEEEEAQTDEHSRNVLAERFKKSMGSVGSLLSNGFKKSFTNLAAGASRNASQNQLNAAEGGVVGGSTNQLNQTSNGILHGSGAKLDIVNREGLGPRSLSDRPGSRNAGGEGLSSGPSLVVRRMSERELILSSRTPPRIESRTDVIGRESLGFRRASVASESNQVAAAPRVSISNVKSSNTTTNS